MATRQLGRWRMTGAIGPVGARPGAMLRSAVSDHAPPRVRDQDPKPGELICRLGQNGETGDWAATDCDDRPLMVTKAGDGTLEIRHASNGDHAGEPVDLGMTSPVPRDANAGGAPGENLPGKAFEAAMASAISPSKDRAHDRGVEGLRGMQAMMTEHYRRR